VLHFPYLFPAHVEAAAPIFGSLVCILVFFFSLIFFSRMVDLLCSFVFGNNILVPDVSAHLLLVSFPL
jgi:hypothetical protein